MKKLVYAEVSDSNHTVLDVIRFDVPGILVRFNHTEDFADNAVVFKFLNDIAEEFAYGYFCGGIDLDIIDTIYIPFVNDKGNFICVFYLNEIEEYYDENKNDFHLNYKIGITDLEDSEYIFRYADVDDKYDGEY